MLPPAEKNQSFFTHSTESGLRIGFVKSAEKSHFSPLKNDSAFNFMFMESKMPSFMFHSKVPSPESRETLSSSRKELIIKPYLFTEPANVIFGEFRMLPETS